MLYFIFCIKHTSPSAWCHIRRTTNSSVFCPYMSNPLYPQQHLTVLQQDPQSQQAQSLERWVPRHLQQTCPTRTGRRARGREEQLHWCGPAGSNSSSMEPACWSLLPRVSELDCKKPELRMLKIDAMMSRAMCGTCVQKCAWCRK